MSGSSVIQTYPRDLRRVTGTECGPPSGASRWSVVTGEGVRRRSRETAARPGVVHSSLTQGEFSKISEAAAGAGRGGGALGAEVTRAAARGAQARAASP